MTEEKDAPYYKSTVSEIYAERIRQITAEGYTPEHDDEHKFGEMANAAAVYAIFAGAQALGRTPEQLADWTPWIQQNWPWAFSTWKPGDARRNLVRAGALIVAEIERLDRAAARKSAGGP